MRETDGNERNSASQNHVLRPVTRKANSNRAIQAILKPARILRAPFIIRASIGANQSYERTEPESWLR